MMTDPIPGDPIAVILARMEVKLDNALLEQGRHSTLLERHDTRLGLVENRVTVLETKDARDDSRDLRMLSARSVAWTSSGVVAAIVGAVAAWRAGGGG